MRGPDRSEKRSPTVCAGPLPGRILGVADSRFIVGALLLLAFVLRLYRLDGQSFWHDEGLSAAAASLAVGEMIAASVGQDQPPGYFLFLHFWIRLAGGSDYSARFLSVAAGMIALSLLWALAARLPGRRVAGLALVLGTISPFQLYYSQETRGYALLVVWSLFATYAYVRAISAPGRGWWVAYGLAAVAAVATHHTGVLPVAVHLLHFLATRPAPSRNGFLAFLTLGLLWALWGILNRLGGDPFTSLVGWGTLGGGALSTWTSFGLGDALDRLGPSRAPGRWPALAALVAGPLWLAAIAGGVALWSGGQRHRLLVGLLLLPPAMAITISLGTRPYVARYVAPSAFLFPVVVAAGAAALWSRRRRLGIASVSWAGAASLAYAGLYLFDPSSARDDHRRAAGYINAEANAQGEAVILVSGHFRPVFERYLDGRLSLVGLPARYGAHLAQTLASLEELAGQYERLWLVSWQEDAWDPEYRVRSWLAGHGVWIETEHFRGVTVRRYLSRSPVEADVPSRARPVDARLGDVARLRAYEVETKPSPGKLRVTLYWEPLRPLTGTDYTVFTHIVSGSHYSWAQKDNRPVYDRFPTSRWPPGGVVADGYDLTLLEGTPPGSYRLAVGMYDTATGDRLLDPQSGRDHLLLGPVDLQGGPIVDATRLRGRARFGELELLETRWEGAPRPGGTLEATLLWRAAAPLAESYAISLRMRGQEGEVALRNAIPGDGDYPTTAWEVGRVVRQQMRLSISPQATGGRYRLQVGVHVDRTGEVVVPAARSLPLLDLGEVVLR